MAAVRSPAARLHRHRRARPAVDRRLPCPAGARRRVALRRVHGARGASQGAQRWQGGDPSGLPRRARRSQRRRRLHRHPRPLAQDHGRRGARRRQGRVPREADDVHGGRGPGRHRRRRSIPASAAGGQPGPEHCAATDRREIVKSGRLGQITLVRAAFNRNTPSGAWLYPIPPDASERTVDWAQFLGPAPKRPFSLERFFRWRCYWDYSGGLATDLFVHLATTIHYVLDVQGPSQVVAAGATHRWKDTHEVPDTIDAILTYPQGFTVTLGCTLNSTGGDEGVHIHGTKGTLHLVGQRTAVQRRAGRRRQPLGGPLMARGTRARVLRGPEGAGHRDAVVAHPGGHARRRALGRQRRERGRGPRAHASSRPCARARRRWKTRASDIAPPAART